MKATARHLEYMRRGRLELWRIRGQTARLCREARIMPPLPRSMASEVREAATAAWLAGYDGRREGSDQ